MFRAMCNLTILMAVWCILSSSVAAQSTAPNQPVSCANANVMTNVNLIDFVGVWYEVARKPANTMQCVQANFSLSTDNRTLTINVTHSQSALLSSNTTMSANITLDSTNTAGYNVTYNKNGVSTPITTFKLLNTDYKNYAFICGFTNASDVSTSFGAILTRQRVPNATVLTGYEQEASSLYANFNNNMPNITQSAKCYTNAASSNLPIFSTIFVALYAINKYLN